MKIKYCLLLTLFCCAAAMAGRNSGDQPAASTQPAENTQPDMSAQPAANNHVRVNTQISTYVIHGSTADQLRAQMNAKGPMMNGKHLDSKYEWYVNWHYDYYHSNGLCGLTNLRVNVSIRETFPAWQDMDKADPALQNKFKAYFDYLQTYAKEYEQSGRAAGDAVANTLENLNPMGSCSEMGAYANQKANEIIDVYNQRDKDFEANLTRLPDYTTFP